MANAEGELDLLPFEEELRDTVEAFIASNDAEEKTELMKTYQTLSTENLYSVGLTAYPGALVVNKRFANVPQGVPIFMFNWAEDNVMRERLYVPMDKQQDLELHPDALPGLPGEDGPVTAG